MRFRHRASCTCAKCMGNRQAVTLPTSPVAMLPRTVGTGSAALGLAQVDDDPTLDMRQEARVLHYNLALRGI